MLKKGEGRGRRDRERIERRDKRREKRDSRRDRILCQVPKNKKMREKVKVNMMAMTSIIITPFGIFSKRRASGIAMTRKMKLANIFFSQIPLIKNRKTK